MLQEDRRPSVSGADSGERTLDEVVRILRGVIQLLSHRIHQSEVHIAHISGEIMQLSARLVELVAHEGEGGQGAAGTPATAVTGQLGRLDAELQEAEALLRSHELAMDTMAEIIRSLTGSNGANGAPSCGGFSSLAAQRLSASQLSGLAALQLTGALGPAPPPPPWPGASSSSSYPRQSYAAQGLPQSLPPAQPSAASPASPANGSAYAPNGPYSNFVSGAQAADSVADMAAGGAYPSGARHRDYALPCGADSAVVYPSLQRDGERFSLGSQRHMNGCKPCSFYCFSKRGCKKDEGCEYCHMLHVSQKNPRSVKGDARSY